MTYNEIESLSPVAEELLGVLRGLGVPFELLIVDDGSTDGSGALADSIARLNPEVSVIHHAENLGLGGVYRSGFDNARGRFLTFFPADGQFPASILRDFCGSAESADLVLGYLPSRPGAPLAKALSGAERLLFRVLVGRIPRFQGVFMLRRELLQRISLASRGRGWGILMEMIVRVSGTGCRVTSQPTAYRPRVAGRSKVMNGRTVVSNFRQLLELRRVLRSETRQS